MDRNERAFGIVIRSVPYGDGNKRITVLSPEWGLRDVVIYGAGKSKRAVKAPLYTEGTFCVVNNREKKLITLSDLIPVSVHENALSSYVCSVSASLLSELALMERGEERIGMYTLFIDAIEALSDERWTEVLMQYIIRYLRLSGFGTDYLACPSCGRKYLDDETLGFSSRLGAPVCKECDDMSLTLILPPNARSYIRDSLHVPFGRALSFKLSENMKGRIFRYLVRTAELTLGAEIKSARSGLLDLLNIV